MSHWWKIVYFFFFGTLFVLVITHPKSAATVFGSIFTGLNGMGATLTGSNSKAS